MKNLYEILGVPETATEADIKRAYRRLAFEYHPDRNPNDASAAKKFREATEAYNALADPGASEIEDPGNPVAEDWNDLERIIKAELITYNLVSLKLLKNSYDYYKSKSKSFSTGMVISATIALGNALYEQFYNTDNDWFWGPMPIIAFSACLLGKIVSSICMTRTKRDIENLEILTEDLESKYGSAYRR